MKKLIPLLTLSLAALTSVTYAQTDTIKLDLGRITVQKQFTQSVTVKGADLQKLPFTTLSDAVNTWFYGVYGTATYVTVIDGNLMADINAYSVFDIDEVTLVQNSLTQLNGISPSQILLLVKTKRAGRGGRSGVDVNGQLNYVNLRNTSGSGKSTGNIYHQYYVSPYVNTQNVKAGFSANFQKSVTPTIETGILEADRPYSITRVKLNAYADLKLTRNVLFTINSGYVPQTDTLRFTSTVPYSSQQNQTQISSLHNNHYLWYGEVKLHANITSHLTNRLSAGMQFYNVYNDQDSHGSAPNFYSDAATNVSNKKKGFLIKDDLAYQLIAGRWTIEPAVNFTYREFRTRTDGDIRSISRSTISGGVNLSGSTMTYWNDQKTNAAILSPSLSISLAKAFMLQGGFQYFIKNSIYDSNVFSGNSDFAKPKIFPFASVTANILSSDGGDNPQTDLMMYGSFAKSMASMSDGLGALSDGTTISAPSDPGYSTGYTFYYNDPTYNRARTFDQLQVGTTLSLLRKKLLFSYNFNVRKDQTIYNYSFYSSAAGGYYAYALYPSRRVDLHRVSLDLKAFSSTNFSWTTGLNFSVAKGVNSFNYTGGLDPYYLRMYIGNVTSGGFINRFAYKRLSAGLDVLYRINEDVYSPAMYNVEKGNVNSFDLKNLYIAYLLSPKWAKSTQLFANARNLIQNKRSTITDNRRYYGVGFMVSL